MIKLKQLRKGINEAIEDIAVVDDKVYGTMGYVMADAINKSKKRREEVKKVMEDRKGIMPNQDRFAHTKDKGTPEMKKMHLSEDAFQLIDLRNRGNKRKSSRKSLRESVDENKLAKFIDNSIKGLQNGDATNYRFKLDDRLAVFVGWSDGYDAKDDDIIHDKEYPTFGINVGVKVWTSDDMWTDYDFLNFAYYENGDIVAASVSVSPNYNANNLADSMIAYYNDLKDLTIEKDGKIVEDNNKVEESLDVSQTNPIDTTKSIAGRKPTKAQSLKEGANNVITQEMENSILNVFRNEKRLWGNAPRIIDYCTEDDTFVVVMGNSNPTYLSSLRDSLIKICDEIGVSFDEENNGEGFYGYTYTFYVYDDSEMEESLKSKRVTRNESFLNETDDVDSKKCADILNNWIDWEEADYDVENAIDQLRSLQTEKAITEKEYDFIVKNWDDLLEEDLGDGSKENLTEGVKFGQSSYEDLVNTVCEYYVDHSGKDALESILGLMKDLDEDNAYKLLYAVAERVEEFVGEDLEDSQKYPIESPFEKKETKGVGVQADQKYPIKPSGKKKDSQFVKAEQKAPVGLTESVGNEISFDKVLPVIKNWCGNILGEEGCGNLAQEFSIGMSKGESCLNILNKVANQYGLDVDEFEGICIDLEDVLLSESKCSYSNKKKKKLSEDVKIISDLYSFEPWTDTAIETWDTIRDNNKLDTLDFMLEDMYPEGISETQLNDLLRFDSEWVLSMLGLSDDDSDEDDSAMGESTVPLKPTDGKSDDLMEMGDDTTVRNKYDIDVSDEEADAIAESLLNMMNNNSSAEN